MTGLPKATYLVRGQDSALPHCLPEGAKAWGPKTTEKMFLKTVLGLELD